MDRPSLNMENTLRLLALDRPIFYSEADFQHALAWKIRELYPETKVRLETPSGNFDKRERIDIVVTNGAHKFALELKYKKRAIQVVANHERFSLTNDGAQDIARYDFFKDVVRLERYVAAEQSTTGYALFLTNDELYWKESARGSNSAAFFMHEGRMLDNSSPLAWHERTGEGTMKGRTESLNPRINVKIQWKDYSELPEARAGRFRYVLLILAK